MVLLAGMQGEKETNLKEGNRNLIVQVEAGSVQLVQQNVQPIQSGISEYN
jgi:hypothetical protein